MQIPYYPEFEPISAEMRDQLHPSLAQLKIGISEFTFANLFLFRETYKYRVSRLQDGNFIIQA